MDTVRTPGPFRRLVRSHGLVRSPLRRTTHRIEAALTALLAMLGLVVVPLAATIALGVYQRELAAAAATAAQRTQVSAALLTDPVVAPPAPSEGNLPAEATAMATWKLPSGQQFTDRLRVDRDLRAGQTVQIWSDRQGHRTIAPKSPGDVLAAALIIGIDLVILGWLLLGALWWLACRGLDRINSVWWEIQWAETGPRWSRRTWQ
ncbi:MAG TPA: hypothetical protein VGI84_00490 [Pseudonocardiaceae bacterium]|jgi:hypothetical protein